MAEKNDEGSAPVATATIVAGAQAQMAEVVKQLQTRRTELSAQYESIGEQIGEVEAALGELTNGAVSAPGRRRSKRGRPKGSKNKTGRGPGRPKTSGKRGRPKGSKNKPKPTAEAAGTTAPAAASATEKTPRQNLASFIQSALSSGPKDVSEVIAAVQKAGYETKADAKTFESIVRQNFTRHSVAFNERGSNAGNPKTDKSGSPIGKSGEAALFTRLGRGVYRNFKDGDTSAKAEAEGAKIKEAAAA